MKKRRRIFIAINLPEDIKCELERCQKEINWAKWTTKDNLHITLEFLGYLTAQELGEVCMIAKEVAKRRKPFSINLNKIVYGPPEKLPPRMIWAIGEKSKELAELKQDLQKHLSDNGSEPRNLSPHITLARINEWEWKKIEPEERPEISEELDLVFTVESIEVMESELKRGGPQYAILESHILSNFNG